MSHEYYQEGRGRVGMPALGYTAECIKCGLEISRRVSGRGYSETVYKVNGCWETREPKCSAREVSNG